MDYPVRRFNKLNAHTRTESGDGTQNETDEMTERDDGKAIGRSHATEPSTQETDWHTIFSSDEKSGQARRDENDIAPPHPIRKAGR